MEKNQYYSFVLANSITSDGKEDFDLFRHNQAAAADDQRVAGSNLIDQYDYVMHGKIFED